MAQTFRPFSCDWPLASPGIPLWDTTEPIAIPSLSWIVLRDGEPLIIDGEIAVVSAPYISREYAGIPYEKEGQI